MRNTDLVYVLRSSPLYYTVDHLHDHQGIHRIILQRISLWNGYSSYELSNWTILHVDWSRLEEIIGDIIVQKIQFIYLLFDMKVRPSKRCLVYVPTIFFNMSLKLQCVKFKVLTSLKGLWSKILWHSESLSYVASNKKKKWIFLLSNTSDYKCYLHLLENKPASNG